MVRVAKQETLAEPSPAPEPRRLSYSGIEGHVLSDDGVIPNNRKLPLVLYRQALSLGRLESAPERGFEALFTSNGWRGVWVDGIYDFDHYHSTAHEVLGIAKGWAKVRFGGMHGIVAELESGDAVAIPAGVAHCLVQGEDLVVVGAYPEGQEWDLCRASKADRAKALENIPWVSLPRLDPVFGPSGPLLTLWVD